MGSTGKATLNGPRGPTRQAHQLSRRHHLLPESGSPVAFMAFTVIHASTRIFFWRVCSVTVSLVLGVNWKFSCGFWGWIYDFFYWIFFSAKRFNGCDWSHVLVPRFVPSWNSTEAHLMINWTIHLESLPNPSSDISSNSTSIKVGSTIRFSGASNKVQTLEIDQSWIG